MASSWIAFGLGIWLIVAPWLLGFGGISLAKWSSVLAGLVLVVTFAWELFAEREETKNNQL